MSYKKLLQRASFRGVRFNVEGSERTLGINYQLHSFPGGKKKALYEELSEEPEILKVNGFLVGEDAQYTRDMLLKVCKKKEPGRLLHPLIGFINARCVSFRIRESFDRVGKISLSLEFVEIEEKESLIPGVDPISLMKDLDDAVTSANLALTEALSLLDIPGYLMGNIAKNIHRIEQMITSKNGFGRISEAILDMKTGADSIENQTRKLINSPEKLAHKIKNSLLMLTNNDYLDVSTSLIKDLKTSDSNRHDAKASKLISMITATACIENIARKGDSERYGEVLQVIDTMIILADGPEVGGMFSLKSVIKQLQNSNRPKTHKTLKGISILAAYEEYGDITLEPEILKKSSTLDPHEVHSYA